MIGKTISHYKIIEKLGKGGMGVVYKAHDTKLDRFVALKFMPPHLITSEDEKKRFIHEAKAASTLDHLNICTIHEIGETDDGQMFIAMACYEGESLNDKIGLGPISIDEALNITIQIAHGLSKAHEKHIIHRDIKPANIMVTTDGVVKIVDFGLAKLSGQTKLTKEGSTLGTTAYMSPEQIQGTHVDIRTDIWSLGVLLYEMVTGQTPFKGDYDQAVLYSIMNEMPGPLTGVRTGVPMELERIVNKIISKNPDERFQTVGDLILDLSLLQKNLAANTPEQQSSEIKPKKRIKQSIIWGLIFLIMVIVSGIFMLILPDQNQEMVASESGLQRIAVLPFANLRSDPETDFLGFALADQVIGALSYIQNILVRPSSAVRQYQNKMVDALSAGKNLKVDFVLTGHYLKEANTIRMNIELINIKSNEMIWRESIEVEYANAFVLQDIVSNKVVEGLKIQFSQSELTRIQVNNPQNPLAYEFYLRSISYPLTVESSKIALGMVNKSIQLDSSYAPTWVELGFRLQLIGNYALSEGDLIDKAENAYRKALSLNKESMDAHQHLVSLYTESARTDEALELAKHMLTINPNNPSVHFSLSYIYRYTGLLEDSKIEGEKALALDPDNSRFRSINHTYLYLNEYDKALQVYYLDANTAWGLSHRGEIYLRLGQRDKAIDDFNQVLKLKLKGIVVLWTEGMKAYLKGDTKAGLLAAKQWEQSNPSDGESWYHIGSLYSLHNESAGCIRSLEKAVEGGFFNYPYMLTDIFLDNVRDDPGFKAVLSLAKEKHERFKSKFAE
jgi:TolB-like protein/tRNA A-37 threonylcarbamoyl transferase component Bud32/Flp pilus assembly protein TadD